MNVIKRNKEQQELHKGNFDAVKRWREKGNLFVIKILKI